MAYLLRQLDLLIGGRAPDQVFGQRRIDNHPAQHDVRRPHEQIAAGDTGRWTPAALTSVRLRNEAGERHRHLEREPGAERVGDNVDRLEPLLVEIAQIKIGHVVDRTRATEAFQTCRSQDDLGR